MMNGKTRTLQDVVTAFDRVLQPQLAMDWDNVGLLVGDPDRRINKTLLCIDLTPAVLREAISLRASLILAYHPPLFKPIKTIRADRQDVLFNAVRSNIAIYSIHTALDMLPGGTSDVLADLVNLKNRQPIDHCSKQNSKSKLVIFVPTSAAEKMARSLFDIGAGRIGEYDSCSFCSAGIGTFRGSEKSHPAVGHAGHFETVDEIRLEVVVENKNIPAAVDAIRKSHPYEEPAFDIYPCAVIADGKFGLGRIGELGKAASLKSIVALIKRRTKLKHLQIADAGVKSIRRVAVGPGSCGDLIAPLAGKINLFITGEVRHHTALDAVRAGVSVICLGHGNSERIALPALRDMVRPHLPEIDFRLSVRDKDPLAIDS
jgi:dinuclear metal center YbgI/SA1388 family protein